MLGCLLEKERTTPDQYPLSLNALVTACNQATSREPVMQVDPHEAEAAVDSLKAQRLARLVHPSHGGRTTRFRQVADETYEWTPAQASVMALLLLRGPQTLSELRSRSERMHEFASLDEVEATLESLAAREEPHAARLERQVGQKELRWKQLIAEEVELPAGPVRVVAPSTSSAVEALTERLAAVEERLATLEAALADLL